MGIVAAKYREYDTIRRRPAKEQTTPRKPTRTTPKKTDRNALQERSSNAIAATPSKAELDTRGLQVPEPKAIPEEEPTPAHIRCALGPTPQKDGAVLGIFDMLSAGTPSKGDTQSLSKLPEGPVAGTPSKRSAPPSSAPQLSRTPQSSGKRFYLDAFGGTPLKRKREGGDQTPASAKKLFATPSFLRRNWPLARIEEDDLTESAPPAGPPLKKRNLVRSLSSIIQGLKKQEEERMDDEWEIMNEIEAEESGEPFKPASVPPPKVMVEDSQVGAEMPLGPDQGAESSEEEGGIDAGALDANGNPRKVWKKKGLKRQTRRSILRPVLHKAKSAPSALGTADGESGDERVEETQMTEDVRSKGTRGDVDDFVDDDDTESQHDSQQPRDEKAARETTKPKAGGKRTEDQDDGKKKSTRKVKPDAHANYRALKIKNKNSKGKGRGRFGRR